EVDLCGHATLASAHVLLRVADRSMKRVEFSTKSGVLKVVENGDRLVMQFPKRPPETKTAPARLLEAVGGRPSEVLFARDYLLVYGSEAEVKAVEPPFD